MARLKERAAALQLRKQGLSYNQIKEQLGIGKGTLSVWLRDYPLSRQRINELRAWNEKRIERFREAMRRKRIARRTEIYNGQKKQLLPLSTKELKLAGLLLYAGEGLKASSSTISLSNTNPVVIRFFVKWLTEIYGVSKKKLTVRLHLYRDMNPEEEVRFWKTILRLRREQFKKPYIKTTSRDRIHYRGGFGHGTCNVMIGDVMLRENIMMGIQVVLDAIAGA